METSFIVIFIPIIIVILMLFQQDIKKAIIIKNKKKEGFISMTNELIVKLIGKDCTITTGSFGSAVIGKVVSVMDNWIEIKTKKGNQLINADYVIGIYMNEKHQTK